MRTDIDIEEMGIAVRPMRWAAFRALVTEEWSPDRFSKAHVKAIRRMLDRVEAIDLADEGEPRRVVATTADLTVRLVRRYADAQPAGLSPFTLKARLGDLRTICSFAVEQRALAVSPFHIRPMKRWVKTGPPKGKRHLSRDECQRLLKVLSDDVASRKGWAAWKARRLRVAVSIALYCGLRRNELLRLQVADLDIPGRLIHVRPHGVKRLKTLQSEDSVPIPEALVPLLEEWLAGWRLAGPEGFPVPGDCPWMLPTVCRRSPWTGGSMASKANSELRRAGERAGIPCRVHFQLLRRTCATALEAMGVNPQTIARILRHSEQVDAVFYRQRDEAVMKAAARSLDF